MWLILLIGVDGMNQQNDIYVTKASMPTYEEYIEAIKPLWDSQLITNMGVYHQELETRLSEYLTVPYVSLMVNGHMALEMALQSFEFPKGGEVITTPFTFISTTHAIVRNGLVPIFCDIKEDGTIDEIQIEELITEKTVAILPVHVYGNVCNMEEIDRIAQKYRLKVIYDAAHAFGIRYKGKGIGEYGDASCFSFHATKVFNTIEGGAVTFHNKEMYEKLYNLKNFGIRGEELVVDVGANAKMNEFSAIMGLCNLDRMELVISKRKAVYNFYATLLHEKAGIHILRGKEVDEFNYAYLPILVTEKYKLTRNKLYDKLRDHNIYARKYFYPLTADQACFKNKYRLQKLECARKMSEQILVLPLYEELSFEEVEQICGCI